MEPFSEYIKDTGYWKHQCFVLCEFDWRKAKDLYENATVKELVELIRGRFHYYNSGIDADT